MIYLVVALIACIGSYKPKKKDPTKQKKKESNYYSYYLNDESKPIKEEEKNKKKFVFKTSKDRLYEEAVKYFGESTVRYRSKDSVIDDYLREQEEMFEGKGRK